MASSNPVTSIATALIGAAGAAAPGVAAVIQQRAADRQAKRIEKNAAIQAGRGEQPPPVPVQKPWPTWMKVAAVGGGVLVGSGILYALYRSMSGGKRRNPGGRRRRRRR